MKERAPLGAVLDETTRLVAAALDVSMVHTTEHLGEGRARVSAGVGWPEGFVGTEFKMSSLRRDGRNEYSNGPVVIADLRTDSEWRAPHLTDHGVVSSVNVVIGNPESPLGVLSANAQKLRAFVDTDIDFLQSVAHMLAAAIESRDTEARMRILDKPRRLDPDEFAAIREHPRYTHQILQRRSSARCAAPACARPPSTRSASPPPAA